MVVVFHHHPPPYDLQIILRPIISTPQEPFEQRFTYPRLRHYDAPWNNLQALPVALKATAPNRDAQNAEILFSTTKRQVKLHHLLLIYTFVPHPENPKLEHQTARFNKLHQLLQQFLVINTMPTKHTFIQHHPIIYAQLRYLTEQYTPDLLHASDKHDLKSVNIHLNEIICHWHLIPPPEPNHAQYQTYNLAEHHSLIVTLPDHQFEQLQLIFNKLSTPYDLTTSPIRPVVKRPRYNPPR